MPRLPPEVINKHNMFAWINILNQGYANSGIHGNLTNGTLAINVREHLTFFLSALLAGMRTVITFLIDFFLKQEILKMIPYQKGCRPLD